MTTRAIGLAFLAYLAVAVAYSWPLAIRLGDVPHDLGDPLMTTWLLWWSGTQALPLTAEWWNAPAFYPATGVFAFSEHLLGLVPIAAPLMAMTGDPLVGHNVTFIATFVLSALGAHFLAYTVTRRHDVSAVAGLAYAFAPYRLGQASHIQVLASHWTPICLAALHRYDATGRPRWAVLAGAAWVLQALSCGYYLLFLAVLAGLWFLWFALGRWPLRKLAVAMAPFVIGALLLAPLLYGYQVILRDTYGFHRSIGEIRFFSADIAGLLFASPELLVWGWLQVFERPESNVFPGLTIVVLAALAVYQSHPFRLDRAEPRAMRVLRIVLIVVLALLAIATVIPLAYGAWRLTVGDVRLISIARADKPLTLALVAALAVGATLPRVRAAFQRRSVLQFYLLAAFAMWLFALGPDPTVMERRALYQAPYGWLMRLPGFDGLRVPARFWMMALVCLSVVAALAVNRLQGRTRRGVVAAAALGLLLDGWPAKFRVEPAPERRPSPPGAAFRLDLPMDTDHDARALYQQTLEGVPLINGFSGYFAPHYYTLGELLAAGDPRILQALSSRGPVGVVIDHASDESGAYRKFVLAYPGAALHETHAGWSSYTLPANGKGDLLPDMSGRPLRIKALTAFPSQPHTHRAIDGNVNTRWSGGPQRSAADFTIELEEPGRVSQLVTDLGEFAGDYPVRLRLEVSPDGAQWETVHFGDAALHAYYAAVRHPKEVPVVYPIDRDNVRFLRMTQLGWGKRDWSIGEVRVLR